MDRSAEEREKAGEKSSDTIAEEMKRRKQRQNSRERKSTASAMVEKVSFFLKEKEERVKQTCGHTKKPMHSPLTSLPLHGTVALYFRRSPLLP